jgi:hypothetical protein
MYKGKPTDRQEDEIIEFNIGTEASPKLVNLGNKITPIERKELLALIRELKDIFAWSYKDLKAYRGDVIQHAIPLKEYANPFR